MTARRPPKPGALTEEIRRLSLIAANIRDMVVFLDLRGVIRWVNDAVVRQFGYKQSELVGSHVYMLQAPGKNPPGIWSGGEGKAVLEQWEGEIVDRRRDGSEFTAHVNSFLVLDERGESVGIATIARDVSERSKAEEALRESEEKFRMLTSSAQDAIIMMDGEGLISFWNEAAEKIFGYASPEVLGAELHALLAPPRYRKAYRGGFAEYRRTGRGAAVGKTLELEAVKRDGTVFPIELSLSSVKLRGSWHAIGILRDITERKGYQRALEERNRELEIISNAALTREFRIKELRDEIRKMRAGEGREGGGG